MTEIKGWLRNNSGLIYFLIAQATLFGGLAFSGWGYMVRLEQRMSTLEIRGSPHLNVIDNRLTVLESQSANNKERLDRLVDMATKK
jgi:uncharacterized coiled-coil protein SlyX